VTSYESINIQGGSETADDSFDPTPIYKRGLWFDNSYMIVRNISLNNSFSISLWARVSGAGNLYSINRSSSTEIGIENYFNFGYND
jgi:hypothetical protein